MEIQCKPFVTAFAVVKSNFYRIVSLKSRGKLSQVDRVARWLSGRSARTVCERSWVRVPVGPCAFSSPVTFGGSVWVHARAASSKGTVSSVPAWFRADSGTNLIKQGEIVTGRPCGSVAQWSECSHGMREVLGSSPGRAMCFFLPCYIWWLSVGPCSGCERQRD